MDHGESEQSERAADGLDARAVELIKLYVDERRKCMNTLKSLAAGIDSDDEYMTIIVDLASIGMWAVEHYAQSSVCWEERFWAKSGFDDAE